MQRARKTRVQTAAEREQNFSEIARIASADWHRDAKRHRVDEYNKNPILCKAPWCSNPIPYEKKAANKFCSKSCSCTFNNNKRIAEGWKPSVESRRQRSETIRRARVNGDGDGEKKAVNRATKVLMDAMETVLGITLSEEDRMNLVPALTKYDRRRYKIRRARFNFNFGLNLYPSLFDLEKLTAIGLYDGTEGGNKLVRDHRVSVHEAIANEYDPYYISHPVNCELMPFGENHNKHDKSSITYEELVRQVDEFDANTASSSPN